MPNKPKIVTRSETTSSVVADNLNKGSALTAAEMDSNLINLRAGFGNVSITDTTIETLTTNDNLTLTANGTGTVEINVDKPTVGNFDTGNAIYIWGTTGSNTGPVIRQQNLNYVPGTTGSSYGPTRVAEYKLNGTDSSSSLNRFRINDALSIDLNGSELTSTSGAMGPRHQHWQDIFNTDGANQGRINYTSNEFAIQFEGSGNNSSTTVLNEIDMLRTALFSNLDTGDTFDVGTIKYFRAINLLGGTGTITIDDEYGLYVESGFDATNKYGVFVNDDSYTNRIGGIRLLNDDIRAYTSGDDLTISCNGTGHITIGGEITVEDDGRIQIGATNSIVIDTSDNIDINGAVNISADAIITESNLVKKIKKTLNTLTSSTAITVNSDNGPIQYVELDHNATFTIDMDFNEEITLVIKQGSTGGTGSFEDTGTATIPFGGNVTPTLQASAGTFDVVRFVSLAGVGIVGTFN